MPKVQVIDETKYPDTGLSEFKFQVDGKTYRVLPKPGSYDHLDKFLNYVKYVCPKSGTSPFTFPRWQEHFEIDRLNQAGQPVERPEKPAKQPPEALQMEMKLGSTTRVVLAYMRAQEAEKLYQEYWPSERGTEPEDAVRVLDTAEKHGLVKTAQQTLKVYLDDKRTEPSGWKRVYWPDEAIELLKTGRVAEISLDHDLGDDQRGTGYDVIKWIEEATATQGFKPPQIHVHTDNASARQKMLQGVKSIERFKALGGLSS